MTTSVSEVELTLESLVSFASECLQQIDLNDNYQILKKLGGGGYASVFMVKDRKTDKKMALKVLDRKRTSERNFLMEFSVSFLLSSHPNIIGSFGTAFKTSNHFGFALELSPVGDLFSLLEYNTRLPEHMVKRCAMQIASALEFIESKGLVHMDIKPENILVFDHECHCIKVTDFGLARFKGSVTQKRSGTVTYMAPEMCQLADKNSLIVDSTLDVWGLGIILYCLLTGELPWKLAIPGDKKYSRFVEWQNLTYHDDPPSSWNKFSNGVLCLFRHLLAIDCTKRCKSSEILLFISESWKVEESQENMLDTKDTFPVESELAYVPQKSGYSTDVSYMPTNNSNRSDSIPSEIISISCQLNTNCSVSECNMTPGHRQDHAVHPMIHMDDIVSFHVGAEVEIG